MKKLKLDLDRIQVESFKVEAVKSDRGTVQAHSAVLSNALDSCESCIPHDCWVDPISYETDC